MSLGGAHSFKCCCATTKTEKKKCMKRIPEAEQKQWSVKQMAME